MDRNTLVRLLVAERVKVLGYIQFLVRQTELSEDIFQDVCALAVEKCDQINDETHFLRWMRTTARLHSMNALRGREKHLSLDDGLLELVESAWSEQDAYRADECMAALRHCIGRLPAKSRELIQRRYFQEMDYSQLATQLRRPLNSLYVTFSRIHASLARCVTAQLCRE